MTGPRTGGAAAPRRARWPWAALVVAVVLVVLLAAAELLARAVVPGVVRSIVIAQLDLPAEQQLEVEASGLLLPQLIAGRLDELQLDSRRVSIGGITGAAHVVATGVPLRGGALHAAAGTVSIDQSEFAALLDRSGLPDADVSLDAPNATLSGELELLGRSLPVGLTVTPGAVEGDLLLTPVSVTIGGGDIDLQALAGLLGATGERLAGPQRICIADRLPAGITLTGLRVEGTRAVADIRADGRIAIDPALLENGTCPR